MGALLDEAAVFQVVDGICPLDRRQPVSYHQRRTPLHEVLDSFLDLLFAFSVEC